MSERARAGPRTPRHCRVGVPDFPLWMGENHTDGGPRDGRRYRHTSPGPRAQGVHSYFITDGYRVACSDKNHSLSLEHRVIRSPHRDTQYLTPRVQGGSAGIDRYRPIQAVTAVTPHPQAPHASRCVMDHPIPDPMPSYASHASPRPSGTCAALHLV